MPNPHLAKKLNTIETVADPIDRKGRAKIKTTRSQHQSQTPLTWNRSIPQYISIHTLYRCLFVSSYFSMYLFGSKPKQYYFEIVLYSWNSSFFNYRIVMDKQTCWLLAYICVYQFTERFSNFYVESP